MLSGILGALLVCAVTLLTQPDAQEKNNEAVVKFDTAEKAWIVGAAFYNARDFESSREPFEAASTQATFRCKRRFLRYSLLSREGSLGGLGR